MKMTERTPSIFAQGGEGYFLCTHSGDLMGRIYIESFELGTAPEYFMIYLRGLHNSFIIEAENDDELESSIGFDPCP